MGSPFGRLTLIVDAAGGGGRVGEELPEVERILASRGLGYRIERIGEPGEATMVARETLAAGQRFLVAVGGDGVVHAVVNGMLEDDRPVVPDPVLGVVSAGATNDFMRTFALPGDASAAIHLAGETVYPLDVGKVAYVDPQGRSAFRYFVNIAEAGLGADVVLRARRRRAGRLGHFLGFWGAVTRAKRARVTVQAARKSYEGEAYNVIVGNGRYSGGGLAASPRSFPGDGVLDVLVMRGPKSDAFTMLPQIYRGEQVPSPHIVELRGKDVRIQGDRPLPLAVDGEPIGSTPAAFRAIPGAILFKI